MFSSNAQFIEKVLSEFKLSVKLTLNEQVRHLVNDTRDVKPGDIFCAVNGTQQKGRDYIADALAKNCHLVLVECDFSKEHGQVTNQENSQGIVQRVEDRRSTCRKHRSDRGFLFADSVCRRSDKPLLHPCTPRPETEHLLGSVPLLRSGLP